MAFETMAALCLTNLSPKIIQVFLSLELYFLRYWSLQAKKAEKQAFLSDINFKRPTLKSQMVIYKVLETLNRKPVRLCFYMKKICGQFHCVGHCDSSCQLFEKSAIFSLLSDSISTKINCKVLIVIIFNNDNHLWLRKTKVR